MAWLSCGPKDIGRTDSKSKLAASPRVCGNWSTRTDETDRHEKEKTMKRQTMRVRGKNPNRGKEARERYEDGLIGIIDATRFMSFSTATIETSGRRFYVKRQDKSAKIGKNLGR